MFWIKMLINDQGPQHSLYALSTIYAYCISIDGTQSRLNQNTIAAINLQRAIRINSWLFHPLLKKLAVVERILWRLGKHVSGRCRCWEVKTRANVWTVRGDKKSGRYWWFACTLGKTFTGVPSFDSSIRLSVFKPLFYLQDTAIISRNIKNKYYLYFYYSCWGLVLQHTIYLSLPDVPQIQGLL